MTADQHADDVRLYGLPHAERMYLDVASLYESEIDPDYDPEAPEEEWTVEEWDVENPLDLMPKADWFLEFLEERLCEEHTHDNDDCHYIFKSPEVLVAAEELRRVIASKVTWQQARHLLAEHRLTVNGDVPLFDGEPIYRSDLNDGPGGGNDA